MSVATIDSRISVDDPPLPNLRDLYEVVNGVVAEPSPMGFFETCVASVLAYAIESHFATHGHLGLVIVEGLFELRPEPKLRRRPDLAFVSYDRLPRDRPWPRGAACGVAPDLAIEVVSPHDLAVELQVKIREYFQCGVRQVWVIYPEHVTAYAYRSSTRIEYVGPDGELDGGDVLPGFRVKLADLVGPPPDAD